MNECSVDLSLFLSLSYIFIFIFIFTCIQIDRYSYIYTYTCVCIYIYVHSLASSLTPEFPTVLVPVSSTVIPLDDLPVYKVGVGFGLATPAPGKFKPEGGTKLITSKLRQSLTLCSVLRESCVRWGLFLTCVKQCCGFIQFLGHRSAVDHLFSRY